MPLNKVVVAFEMGIADAEPTLPNQPWEIEARLITFAVFAIPLPKVKSDEVAVKVGAALAPVKLPKTVFAATLPNIAAVSEVHVVAPTALKAVTTWLVQPAAPPYAESAVFAPPERTSALPNWVVIAPVLLMLNRVVVAD